MATVLQYVREEHNRAFSGAKLKPLLKGSLILFFINIKVIRVQNLYVYAV